MAKKLVDIQSNIIGASIDFYSHLERILPSGVWVFLNSLKERTSVYLFSGVIRNYFIERKDEKLRDVDFMIYDELDIEKAFPNLEISKNSFGGYKIIIEELTIDLWIIKHTWGLNQGQLKLEINLLEQLPNTTFFSFSSIIYSLNDKKFIIGLPFLRFIRDKKIDVVLENNPYPALCIVNSFYYSDKYKFNFSDKLKGYIKKYYVANIADFDKAQIKHFGKILYSKDEILHRIKSQVL